MGSGGRLQFVHDGQLIYEWEQSMDEVRVYIKPPAGITSKHLKVEFKPHKVSIGIKGNPPFIDESTFDSIVVDDSLWSMDDSGEIEINLQKAKKALTWDSVFIGHSTLDEASKIKVQEKMTLERFQEEHPGFDFSGAKFNGAPPDPRTFMGGVKYT